MFTGIIQTTGKILQVSAGSGDMRLHIQPLKPITDYINGESIAVNGACLTVEDFAKSSFWSYASAETLSKTNLGSLNKGSEVNLERALRLGDSMGGHMVSGHVDTLCTVEQVRKEASSIIYRFSCPPEHARYIIPKGSVALNGISLTVNECGTDFFEVNIIPATQSETTIAGWKKGFKINLETDIIGKYVERMVAPWQGSTNNTATESSLTLDFFRSNGF